MPRGQRPFRRVAIASWIAAVLLGVTIQAAHADTEPPSDRSTEIAQDTDAQRFEAAAAPADPVRLVARPWPCPPGPLYGVPMGGADMDALLGAESGTVTIGADIEAMSGSTHYGLGTTGLNAGPFIEGHFDRLHIGGGVRLGAFNVNRATSSGGLFSSSEGVFLRVSVDVFRFDGDTGAVFLFAKGSADTVGGALYGVACGAGVRF